jgi:hypothetical protein
VITISRRASSSSRRRARSFTPDRVIDVDHINEFKEYTVAWFANAALTYFSSINIYRGFVDPRIIRGSYEIICSEAQLLLQDKRVKKIEDEVKGGEKRKGLAPIPLNDAVQHICDIARGLTAPSITSLEWYFAPEFGEFVKTFIPYRYTGDAYARRKVYGISTDIASLAVIGVYIAYVYKYVDVHRDVIEYGFIFLDAPEPHLVNIRRLQDSAIMVMQAVHSGKGSKITSYVGVASAIAYIVGSMLNYLQPFTLHFIRLSSEAQKVRIIGVDFVDLTALARTLHRLRISGPVYTLIRLYPSEDKQKSINGCKQFRRFLEELSRATMIYAELGDAEALYKVLRSIVHEDSKINDDINVCLKALIVKIEWDELRMSLFSINI